MNNKIVIHQPSKYGDYINVVPIAQKLSKNGYEVWLPYCHGTKELIDYFNGFHTFEVGAVDAFASELFASRNDAMFINCQSSPEYSHLCTVHGGQLFIEELKYYVVNDKVELDIKYEDKFNFTWNRNYDKENQLIKLLGVNIDETEYIVTHTIGDNGRTGLIPNTDKRKRIEIQRIQGYTLLDWYPIIKRSAAIYAIQSSAQCFIDCIKAELKDKELYLINDTSNPDRLLVPAYGWNMNYFINNRLA